MGKSSWMCTFPGEMAPQFVRTQNIEPVDQLNCGARVLDLRLNKCHGFLWPFHGYAQEKMRFSHNDVIFDQQPKDEVPKLVDWAVKHPDELVILYFQKCQNLGKKDCTDDELLKVLADNGVYVLNPKAEYVDEHMTVHEVKGKAKMTSAVASNGRHHHAMVAILTNGVEDNWDKNVRWYHNERDPGARSWPIFEQYRDNTLARHSSNRLWQLQAFWQQDSAISLDSTVPADNGMNPQLYKDLESGMYDSKINILTVNWICHGGFDIADKVSQLPGSITTISQADKDQCKAACGYHYTPLH